MIDVVVGALGDHRGEGVVCPVRSDLSPVTAGARDLLTQAGEVVTEAADRLGPVPVGGAFVAPGGDLQALYVIFAVTASDDEPETWQSVQKALRNVLRRAADLGMESLELPPLGLGAGQLEAEDMARSMVEILTAHLDEGGLPRTLTLVAPGSYERDVFAHFVGLLAPDHTVPDRVG